MSTCPLISGPPVKALLISKENTRDAGTFVFIAAFLMLRLVLCMLAEHMDSLQLFKK